MSKYMDRAHELRDSVDKHYNCCQSVVVPFAEAVGISEEQAYRTAANFGHGMKMGAVCGVVTGALMVMGLCGVDDGATTAALYAKLRERHEGYLDCANLLRINKEKGRERKPHCDGMVYEMIELLEEILTEKGIIK